MNTLWIKVLENNAVIEVPRSTANEMVASKHAEYAEAPKGKKAESKQEQQ